LTFNEFKDINEIEKYKNMYLTIEEEQLPPLDTNEYYYYEIIGCHVYLPNGDILGTVKEILSPGANDVWVVDCGNKKDVLIPYIDDVVTEVNLSKKMICIEPMDGLLERSEEHTSELQSRFDLVCRLLLEKKKNK